MGFKIIAAIFLLILFGFALIGFAAVYLFLVEMAEERESEKDNNTTSE